jgi:hypothetical protein
MWLLGRCLNLVNVYKMGTFNTVGEKHDASGLEDSMPLLSRKWQPADLNLTIPRCYVDSTPRPGFAGGDWRHGGS